MKNTNHGFKKRLTAFAAFAFTAFMILSAFIPVVTTQAASFENLYAFNKSYCGIVNSSATNVYDHRYHTSGYINVTEGDTLTFGPCYPSQTLYLTTFNSSKKVTNQISDISKLTNKANFTDGTSIMQYTVPAGVSYVRVTCQAEVYNTFVITKNSGFSVQDYNSYLASIGLTKYSEWRLSSAASSLSGKKLLWCGDSIGVGYYEHYYPGTSGTSCTSKNKNNGEHPAWAKRITNLLDMASPQNTSKGGASLSTKRSNVTNIFTQLKNNASNTYDYIIIEGGSVDVGGSNGVKAPLGKLSSSYDLSSFDGENTFVGALERSFYYATSKAPNSHIAFIIAYSMPEHPNNYNAWNEYWQYVPYVCEKWGISCIDLCSNTYVNKTFDENRIPDGNSETAYYYDALHISPMGYSVTALEIAMELVNVPKYSTSLRHMPDNIPDALKTGSSSVDTTPVTPDPSIDPVPFPEITNLFVSNRTFAGRIGSDGEEISDPNKYFTTDYINVTPGSVLYYAAAVPSQGYQLVGFNSSNVSQTKWVKGSSMKTIATLSGGKVIYAYTVPTNVKKIRITFAVGTDPLITLDQPFDAATYAQHLNRGQSSEQTTGTTVTTAPSPDTSSPVTTPSVTTPSVTTPSVTNPSDTTPITTSPVVTTDPASSPSSEDITPGPDVTTTDPAVPETSEEIGNTGDEITSEIITDEPSDTSGAEDMSSAEDTSIQNTITDTDITNKDNSNDSDNNNSSNTNSSTTSSSNDSNDNNNEKGCSSALTSVYIAVLVSFAAILFVQLRKKELRN